MSDETKTTARTVKPKFDDDRDGPYALDPLYVNYAEVVSNPYELRVLFGRLPGKPPTDAEEFVVPKLVELIIPPVVAEQVAKLILANIAERQRLPDPS